MNIEPVAAVDDSNGRTAGDSVRSHSQRKQEDRFVSVTKDMFCPEVRQNAAPWFDMEPNKQVEKQLYPLPVMMLVQKEDISRPAIR